MSSKCFIILSKDFFYYLLKGFLFTSFSIFDFLSWCSVAQIKRKVYFFFNFFFFYFTILYWFCHTSTCICHGCTHVPHPDRPPPTTTLPIPSLWVIPMHQPQASCILNGIETCIISYKKRITLFT